MKQEERMDFEKLYMNFTITNQKIQCNIKLSHN